MRRIVMEAPFVITIPRDQGWLTAIAPFVEHGSYIQVSDGNDVWRWIFRSGQLRRGRAIETWRDALSKHADEVEDGSKW